MKGGGGVVFCQCSCHPCPVTHPVEELSSSDEDRDTASDSRERKRSSGKKGEGERRKEPQRRSPLAVFDDLTQFLQPEPPHLARGASAGLFARRKKAFKSDEKGKEEEEGGEKGGFAPTHLSNDLPERGKEKWIQGRQQRWQQQEGG